MVEELALVGWLWPAPTADFPQTHSTQSSSPSSPCFPSSSASKSPIESELALIQWKSNVCQELHCPDIKNRSPKWARKKLVSFIFFEEALFSEVLRKAYILVSIVHLGRSWALDVFCGGSSALNWGEPKCDNKVWVCPSTSTWPPLHIWPQESFLVHVHVHLLQVIIMSLSRSNFPGIIPVQVHLLIVNFTIHVH